MTGHHKEAVMADEPTPPVTGDPTPTPPGPAGTPPTSDPQPRPDDVEAMKAALAKANKEAADARGKLKEIEDRDKSETQRAQDAATEAGKRADAAESKALRLQIASDKGLTAAQAKRLVGNTKEELEADADEILRDFPAVNAGPPSQQPRPALRGGADPTSDPVETDPAKLAALVPRL